MNWLYYLLEGNLYLGVFYLCYSVFLNKETHYALNRIYLLFSSVVSFVLPVMQIGALKPAGQQVVNVVLLPPANVQQNSLPVTSVPVETHFDMGGVVLCSYLLGVIFFALLFAWKLYNIFKLSRKGSESIETGYKLIQVGNSNTAFSFFNYLFLGTETTDKQLVITHELVHIRQKHSLDIVLLEIFKVVNWFNPIVYLLQNSLKNIHEYIADEKTATLEADAFSYSDFLVNNAYGIGGPSFTNSFFNYNLLKKRIIMLHQKRSGKLARLKYLIALPVCAGSLCTSTLGFSKSYGWVDLAPTHKSNVQILNRLAKNDTLKSAADTLKITKKGYRYKEDGYLIKNKTTDFRVIIIDKNGEKGYFRNESSAAQLKLLKEKYGYTFPAMKIYPMLPPPPPVAPMALPAKAGKIAPPPPPAPLVMGKGNLKGKSGIQKASRDTLSKEGADNFRNYVGKNTRFPKIALDSAYAGRMIASFSVDGDNKITNVAILRSPAQCFNGEVERVLMEYKGPDLKPNTNYSVPISFVVIDKNGNSIGGSSREVQTYKHVHVGPGKNWMLDEVVVAAYK